MASPLIPSILTSVKKSLNIQESVKAFDPDIILLVNSSFSELHQMGVGPDEGFSIEDETADWEDFTDNFEVLGMVQEYVYLSVRLVFDPPTASVLTAIEKKRDELEWRLNVAGDKRIMTEEVLDED